MGLSFSDTASKPRGRRKIPERFAGTTACLEMLSLKIMLNFASSIIQKGMGIIRTRMSEKNAIYNLINVITVIAV